MFDNVPMFLQRFVALAARAWPWLGRRINGWLINRVVNQVRHRPHPWSTVSDYVSWTSLTDQKWSARHLPATRIPDLPAIDRVLEMFRQPGGRQRLSRKSTCLFPAFAQYLTDGFIRTRMPNISIRETDDLRRQNTSNHQIDLCTLYGRTEAQTAALRLGSSAAGQRGRIKSQTINGEEYSPFLFVSGGQAIDLQFAVLDLPLGLDKVTNPAQRALLFAVGGDRVNAAPQIAMVHTLLLREHNRLAGLIEKANPAWDDERVFQTTRNSMIVMFIKIVVEEYINHISPSPIRLIADPSVAWDAPWNKPNWITTEFSLLYRWHSLIPDTLQWNGTVYPAGATMLNNQPLLDAGLLRAFIDMSTQPAGELGAFNTADALMDFEKKTIMQGRICEVAAYGDYRQYIKTPRPADFGDISSNPKVVEFLKNTYRRVEDVEFYVGLFAEEPVKNSPLPLLMLTMVAIDAFSQALTNPLLSKYVFKPETFTQLGWDTINATGSLRDILVRNYSAAAVDDYRVSMTQENWDFI